MILADHYTNYLEILDKIKTRPRLPSPVMNKKMRSVRWSDSTNMSRSVSYDHLVNMRSAVKRSVSTDNIVLETSDHDTTHHSYDKLGTPRSVSTQNIVADDDDDTDAGDLRHMCDKRVHSRSFTDLMRILRDQERCDHSDHHGVISDHHYDDPRPHYQTPRHRHRPGNTVVFTILVRNRKWSMMINQV